MTGTTASARMVVNLFGFVSEEASERVPTGSSRMSWQVSLQGLNYSLSYGVIVTPDT